MCNRAVTYLSSKRCSAPPLPAPHWNGSPCRRDPLWFPCSKRGRWRNSEVCPISPIPQLCSHVTLGEGMSPATHPPHPPPAASVAGWRAGPKGKGERVAESDLLGTARRGAGLGPPALASLLQTEEGARAGRHHCTRRGTPSPGPAEGPTPGTMRGGAGADDADNGPRPPGTRFRPFPAPAGGRAPGRPARLSGPRVPAQEGLGLTRAWNLPRPCDCLALP